MAAVMATGIEPGVMMATDIEVETGAGTGTVGTVVGTAVTISHGIGGETEEEIGTVGDMGAVAGAAGGADGEEAVKGGVGAERAEVRAAEEKVEWRPAGRHLRR